MLIRFKQKKFWWVIAPIFLIAIFLSAYKLSESPPIWYDEGIFTQVAINMARGHGHRLQVAPAEFVSGQAVTTGFSVTYPISLVFKYFGVTLINARIVMVVFLILTIIVSFFFIYRLNGVLAATYSLLLLASFGPLYGHGKSVMGEAPGVFFFLLFLYALYRLEKSKSVPAYILSGLFAGLCVITKPTLLILLPVIVGVGIIFYKKLSFSKLGLLWFFAAFTGLFAAWLVIQFSGYGGINELAHYVNPNSVNIGQAIMVNVKRFFSELQPAYFLTLLTVWGASIVIRWRRRAPLTMAECAAFGFSLLTLASFFRTSGYYRYFFPGQVIALLFLPFSVLYLAGVLSVKLAKISRILQTAPHIFLAGIIIFQFYQTNFHSWVAAHYNGNNSAQLEIFGNSLPAGKTIFLYNVPEVAIFLPEHIGYYQYLKISRDISVGGEQLKKIQSQEPDQIIMNNLYWSENHNQFAGYEAVSTSLSRYAVLERPRNAR